MTKLGMKALFIGAAALFISVTQAFAVPLPPVEVEVFHADALPYLYDGGGGVNSHYATKFTLSGHTNWSDFHWGIKNAPVTSFHLQMTLIPLEGFDTDRIRLFTHPGTIGASNWFKLTPIAGSGVAGSGYPDEDTLPLADLGISLASLGYILGTHTHSVTIDVNLLDWYDAAEITNVLLSNYGMMNIGYGDDAEIISSTLTVTVPEGPPVPEPASLLLFGSGLVGLAAWRLRKNQSVA